MLVKPPLISLTLSNLYSTISPYEPNVLKTSRACATLGMLSDTRKKARVGVIVLLVACVAAALSVDAMLKKKNVKEGPWIIPMACDTIQFKQCSVTLLQCYSSPALSLVAHHPWLVMDMPFVVGWSGRNSPERSVADIISWKMPKPWMLIIQNNNNNMPHAALIKRLCLCWLLRAHTGGIIPARFACKWLLCHLKFSMLLSASYYICLFM